MIVLQILGWILAGILLLLLLIFLLLLPSVRVHFSGMGGDMKATVYYLFLRFRVYPTKEKPEKPKKKRRKKPDAPKEDEPPPEKKKVSPFVTFKQYKPFIHKAKKVLRALCKRLVIYKVKANIKISGADAHQTALKYAKAASFLAIFLQILSWAFTVKKPDIAISPDFLSEKSAYDISLRLRIRPVFFLIAGARLLPDYLKVSRQDKKTRKGGKK